MPILTIFGSKFLLFFKIISKISWIFFDIYLLKSFKKRYNSYVKSFKEFEELLKERILILDGAMGTELQKFNLNLKCNEELNLKNPEIVKKVHLNYLKAEADIIETNTFNGNFLSLKEYGLENKIFEINKRGVEIAKDAIKDFGSKEKKFIAGSIGPSNHLLSFSEEVSFEEMKDSFFKQIIGLLEVGVDFLLFETIQDPLNAKAFILALEEAKKEFGEIPFFISITPQKDGKVITGQGLDSFVFTFLSFNPYGFGLNCGLGPEDLEISLKKIRNITDRPIIFYPNAGFPDEEGNYNCPPKKFSKILSSFARRGFANVLGGCCGTNPEFIRNLKISVEGIKPVFKKLRNKVYLSGLEIFEINKENKPLFIGERCNIKGCREFRSAIFQNDFERAKEIALEQVREGSIGIDIFLEEPERSEFDDFKEFLGLLLPSFKEVIFLDSKNLEVLNYGLKKISGKGVINSVNLEDEESFLKISKIAKKYGAFLVFQTISSKEKILNLSSEEKIKIALEGVKILKDEINFPINDIIFDPVILPLTIQSEKKNHAYETLKTIKKLKKIFPKNLTILGISNISFGFPKGARVILNSVFLYYATKYGLDLAILNPKKMKRFFTIEERERILAYNIIFKKDKRFFKEFLDYFKEEIREERAEKILKSEEEQIKESILKGIKIDLKENLGKLIKKGFEPEKIIEKILIPSMEELGERFKKNEVILPEVLESASSMKYALEFLKPFMKREYKKRAKILIATVKGDVHDIGKNLFGTLCENSGYEVIDLGVKVEEDKILKSIEKFKPEVIGLSGLLTKSCFEMVEVAKVLSKLKEKPILLLGGAALTQEFVEKRISPSFKGKIFYCSTAMEGLVLLNQLFSGEKA